MTAGDYIQEADFRRLIAEACMPHDVRGGMDKLKKILDRARFADEIASNENGQFKFGDLVAVLARSRSSDFKNHAARLPHTQLIRPTGLDNKTRFAIHVALPAITTLPEANRLIAQLVQENRDAHEQISHLKSENAEHKARRERGKLYGSKPRG